MRTSYTSEAAEPSPIKLRVMAARRARAAIGVTSITLLTIALGCLYRLLFQQNPYGIQAVLGLAVVGLVLLSLGGNHRTKRMTEMSILRFYRSPRFYGVVVSITAGLLFAYALTLRKETVVQARVIAPAAMAPEPAPAPVAPIYEFPKLQLTGVILNGSRSVAIINQRTVELGATIEGVKLIEIREGHIVVEHSGLQKTIRRYIPPPVPAAKVRKAP